MDPKNVIYIGADDSNHCGVANGEIDVVTFSQLEEDGVVRDYPNRRDHDWLEEWLKNPKRDYRFSILLRDPMWKSRQNLPRIVPHIIRTYLSQLPAAEYKVCLALDGETTSQYTNQVLRGAINGIEVEIMTYTKKRIERGRLIKRPHCPATVYAADIIANRLFKQGFEVILKNPNLVVIPEYSNAFKGGNS